MLAKAAALLALLALSATGGDERYFPPGALNPSNEMADSFRNDWFSKHLRAMDEPVLRTNGTTRSYRFTWLRTFHHPVSIRVVSNGGEFELVATELDGAGGYDPGAILRTKRSKLTEGQFADIEALITKQGFWSIPVDQGPGGADGSEWIVEGAISRYHVVVAWTPESGPVRVIGDRFLQLAGWKYPAGEKY